MIRITTFLGIIAIVAISLAGCSTPQTQVNSPYTVKERISLGEHKVIVYSIADTMSSFAKYRYVPVYRFDVVGEKGEIKQQYIGAVQEYLSRVAGTLRPEQKSYLQSLPLKTIEQDSATFRLIWSVPNYDGDVSDVQDATSPIKTQYWSMDKISGNKSEEVLTTEVVSIPWLEKRLRQRRTVNEAMQLLHDGEEHAYYEFKRYVIAQLGK